MDYIRYYDTQAAYNADTTRLNPSLSYIESTGEAVIDYTPIPPQIARVRSAEDFTGTTFTLPAEVISVDIPDDVTEIGTSAFYEYSSLTEIDLPSGVTTIGGAAFSKCTSLTSIDLPSGVTSIGQNAFKNCSSLESVTVRATTPPTVYPNSFENTPANMAIYVPAESVEAYKAASGWSNYASRIQAIPSE